MVEVIKSKKYVVVDWIFLQLSQMMNFTVISDNEKVRTAKDILCFMYLLNDMHVIAHLGNIREELNKWCDEIKNEYLLQN